MGWKFCFRGGRVGGGTTGFTWVAAAEVHGCNGSTSGFSWVGATEGRAEGAGAGKLLVVKAARSGFLSLEGFRNKQPTWSARATADADNYVISQDINVQGPAVPTVLKVQS
jgi:hypothetical protein